MSTTLEIAPQAPSSTEAPCCTEEPVAVAPPFATPGPRQLPLEPTATLDRHDIELLCGVER